MPIYNNPYPATYAQMYQMTPPPQYPQAAAPYQNSAQTYGQSTQNPIIWVTDARDIDAYHVAPNCVVIMRVTSTPDDLYIKQADASGRPFVEVYKRADNQQATLTATTDEEAPEFATKADLAVVNGALRDEITSMSGTLSAIRGDIETMRGDLYGIAGKKKSSKKGDDAE